MSKNGKKKMFSLDIFKVNCWASVDILGNFTINLNKSSASSGIIRSKQKFNQFGCEELLGYMGWHCYFEKIV